MDRLVSFLLLVAKITAQVVTAPNADGVQQQVTDVIEGAASNNYRTPYGSPQYVSGPESYDYGSSRLKGYDNYESKPQNYGFSCYGRPAALYGDGSYDCRIFHVCQADGRADTLRCPPKTRFNNYLGICDWEFKIDRSCMPINMEEYSYGSQAGYSRGNSYGENYYPAKETSNYRKTY